MSARTLTVAVVLAAAVTLQADEFTARAQLGYQLYEIGGVTSSGFRQTYDIGIRRGVTANSRLGLFFRADDFRGVTESGITRGSEKSSNLQLQPIGEFVIDAETLRLQLRTETLRDRAFRLETEALRTTERTNASLEWTPDRLPSVRMLAFRNAVTEGNLPDPVADESLALSVLYPWRGLSVSGLARHTRVNDPTAGYERTMQTMGGQAGYTLTPFGGKLTLTTDASVERSKVDERATGGTPAQVRVPVRSRTALHVVDDTPLDHRDRPLVSVPALRDGNLDTLTQISIGPESTSFQNVALDFGRVETLEELRLTVRDAAGNPLRNAADAVTWDAYVSEDGNTWMPVSSAISRFDVTRSTYIVTFDEVATRWAKLVSFGTHFEPAFLTEMTAFDIVTVAPGAERNGTQDRRGGTFSATFAPNRRFSIGYDGAYSSIEQRFAAYAGGENTTIDHSAAIQFEVLRSLTLRSSANRSELRGLDAVGDGSEMIVAGIDYVPTSRLRISVEAARQSQIVLGIPSTLETRSIRLYGLPVRSVTLSVDAGVQTQVIPGLEEDGDRTFVNISATARVTRTVRAALYANLQRAESVMAAPGTLLLGPPEDYRYAGEFTWHPGRQLLLSTRLGWATTQEQEGLTQRYRAEWQPFADGSISLAASYNQDVDPLTQRRASRLMLNPRWTMSRYLALDVNYTAVASESASLSDRQKSVYATLTVTK